MIVSLQEWEAARQQVMKEKELTRTCDLVAAERRRMPWLAVEKQYEFDGPKGKASPLDVFEDRCQLSPWRSGRPPRPSERPRQYGNPAVGRLIALHLSLPPFAASPLSPFPNRRTAGGCWTEKDEERDVGGTR